MHFCFKPGNIFIYLVTIMTFFHCPKTGFAQSMVPNFGNLKTQTEINSLPPLSVINEDVNINSGSTDSIIDLSYFEQIDSIIGNLTISNVKEDTIDLSNLKYLSGGLTIENDSLLKVLKVGIEKFIINDYTKTIRIANNPELASVCFDNLDTIPQYGFLNITGSSSSPFITFEKLRSIKGSLSMSDIDSVNIEIPLLTQINGSLFLRDIGIGNLDFLSQLSIMGYLSITNTSKLVDLSGLANINTFNDDVFIDNCPIEDLSFLSSLRVAGKFYIENCTELTDISDLKGLISIGEFGLKGNTSLSSCCIVADFFSKNVVRSTNISGNGMDCKSQLDIFNSCLDIDDDGIYDDEDNCPAISNADQADSNTNGIGDACESTSGSDASRMTNESSDIYIQNSARGIIMKAPNGKCYRYVTDNDGNLTSRLVTCPD